MGRRRRRRRGGLIEMANSKLLNEPYIARKQAEHKMGKR